MFGMESPEDIENEKFHPLFEEASPINHLSRDDVPVMAYYNQPNNELPPNSSGGQHIHHPKFGIVLKEKMEEHQRKVHCIGLKQEKNNGKSQMNCENCFFERLLKW